MNSVLPRNHVLRSGLLIFALTLSTPLAFGDGEFGATGYTDSKGNNGAGAELQINAKNAAVDWGMGRAEVEGKLSGGLAIPPQGTTPKFYGSVGLSYVANSDVDRIPYNRIVRPTYGAPTIAGITPAYGEFNMATMMLTAFPLPNGARIKTGEGGYVDARLMPGSLHYDQASGMVQGKTQVEIFTKQQLGSLFIATIGGKAALTYAGRSEDAALEQKKPGIFLEGSAALRFQPSANFALDGTIAVSSDRMYAKDSSGATTGVVSNNVVGGVSAKAIF